MQKEQRQGEAKLLRAREVAEQLAISEDLVWRLADRGVLPRIRLGGATRYRAEDVEALISPESGDPAGRPGRAGAVLGHGDVPG